MPVASILALIFQFLPYAIQGVESIVGAGNGAAKKTAVTNMANAVVSSVTAVSTGGQKATLTEYAPIISAGIDSLVTAANAAGVFGKTEQPSISGAPSA